jgi:hypothetical protein
VSARLGASDCGDAVSSACQRGRVGRGVDRADVDWPVWRRDAHGAERVAAYVRICHPAGDETGRVVRWAEVARTTGGTAHPLMQWHALVGSPDPLNITDSRWPGTNPRRGNLAAEPLAVLCGVLAAYTVTADNCCFCLGEGYGWIDRARSTLTASRSGAGAIPAPRDPPFTASELQRPRVALPGRRYLLLSGLLSLCDNERASRATPGGDPRISSATRRGRATYNVLESARYALDNLAAV